VHLKEKRKPFPPFLAVLEIVAVHYQPPYTLKIPSVYSSIGMGNSIESVAALRVFQYHISKLEILHIVARRKFG